MLFILRDLDESSDSDEDDTSRLTSPCNTFNDFTNSKMEFTSRNQLIFCVLLINIQKILLPLRINHFFLQFEFFVWVLNFACSNFARIFFRGSLISRFFYNREKREIKYE